jgi:membrane-associated phospholipid phosphatase
MAADGAASSVARSDSSSVALPLPTAPRHALVSFLLNASPFFLSGFMYEGYRRLVHFRGTVHVADLFEAEARLFPVTTSTGTRALSDVIASHTNPFLDVVTGITYFLFMLAVFGVATYLFFRARPRMFELAVSFVLMNVAGWTIWLVYPAAPPWYVDTYGLGPAVLDVASSPAGLSRFDALLGFPLAATFYAGSANVFGAMPSLHVAYATLVAWLVFPLGRALRWSTLAFAVSMAFSAVYLRHHYILDVIFGALLAVPFALFGPGIARRLRPLVGVPA